MRRAEGLCYALAALCLALGLLLWLVYTPMRFTGQLFCCAAGVLAALGLLSRWSGTKPWARWCRRVLVCLLAAGFALFAAMEIRVLSWARTDTDTRASAIIVLGAGVNGTTPSLSLKTRLEAALAYAQDNPDLPVVVSGCQGPGEDISEAECMAQWLAGRGLPPERIILEDQAANTEQNIRFSLRLLAGRGVDITGPIALITSDYHLCRAALHLGETAAVPVAARLPARYLPLTVNYYMREAFAVAAAVLLP